MSEQQQEKQVIEWIYQLTSTRLTHPICDSLKSNSVTLCKLINAIKPNTIKKINNNNSSFATRENLVSFSKGCECLNSSIEDIAKFPEFVFEDKDSIVIKILFSLMKQNNSGGNNNNSNNTVVERERPTSPTVGINGTSSASSSASANGNGTVGRIKQQMFNQANGSTTPGDGGYSISPPKQPIPPPSKPSSPLIKRVPLPPQSHFNNNNNNSNQSNNSNNSNNNNNNNLNKPIVLNNNNNNNNTPPAPPKAKLFKQPSSESGLDTMINNQHQKFKPIDINSNSNEDYSTPEEEHRPISPINLANSVGVNRPPPPALPPRKPIIQSYSNEDIDGNQDDDYQEESYSSPSSSTSTSTTSSPNINNNSNSTYNKQPPQPPISPRKNTLQTSFSSPSLTPQNQVNNNQNGYDSPKVNNNNNNNINYSLQSSLSTPSLPNVMANPHHQTIKSPTQSNRSSVTLLTPINPQLQSVAIPINNSRLNEGYGTISLAGSPPTSPPFYAADNQPYGTVGSSSAAANGGIKKPRSSTKQRLEKFFSKSSLTSKSSKQVAGNSPNQSPQLATSPSSISSPSLLSSSNGGSSGGNILSKSVNANTVNSGNGSMNGRDKDKKTIRSPDLSLSNNGDYDDDLANSGGGLNGASIYNSNDGGSISNSGGYGDTNEVDPSSDDVEISSEELMKLISQVEFLHKDRKIIKERVNFTYPEKYKSFLIYDELLQTEKSATFVTSQLMSMTPRQQFEYCKKEERRMLSEIFTLNNVLNIVEENKALLIRAEEYQKMVDSLIVDKKSMTAKFDEMLVAKAKSEAHQIEEEGIIFSEVNGKMEMIKGGTTEKLIERLYNKNIIGSVSDYVDTFLLTYRSFTTSKFVLDRLTKTYNDNVLSNEDASGADSEKQFQVEQQNLGKKKIRLRICNFLKRWIDSFFHDFDTELLQEYNLFISNCKDEQLHNLLRRALDKKLTGASSTKLTTFGTKAPAPIVPKTPIQSFDDVDPTELARQLTIIEFELFKSIASKELLSLSWQKSDKEKRSPNLLKMIHRFNEVSNWVVTTLIRETNLKKRGQHLKKFIKLMEELRKLNNFNCVFVVVSALHSASVNRLSKTWGEMSKQQQKQFDEFVALTSPNFSFSAYREEIHNVNPPCIPYLGVHLSDLTFIEEGNPDKLENGFVNFFKCRMVAEVIKEIQRYQQQPYNLVPVPEVSVILANHKIVSESDCFKLSLVAEPRESITS